MHCEESAVNSGGSPQRISSVAALAAQPAPSFSDEQAAQGLAITDELLAHFLHPVVSAQAASPLLQLPAELLPVILSRLDARDLARLTVTCRSLCHAPPPLPPPRQIGPVETELRRRAEARGLDVGSSLPEGSTSWVACLLKRDRRDAQMRQATLAVEFIHSLFVDKEGRLLTCGRDRASMALGHAVDPDADTYALRNIGPPTPMPSMQDRRIVSVATSNQHSLALSADGEVYSWGGGSYGALGHGDAGDRSMPSWIESLSRIKRITAGPFPTSAAVDEDGRLFTWGRGSPLKRRKTRMESMKNFKNQAVWATSSTQRPIRRLRSRSTPSHRSVWWTSPSANASPWL